MGIFDFFKIKKSFPKIKKIKFDKINDFIFKKKQEIKSSEIKVLDLIKKRVNLLTTEFENEIYVIGQINLDKRKVEEKIKLIVKNNLDVFVDHFKKLKNNLENLNFEELQNLIEQIDSNLQEFGKKTHINFEKATFLVGEELGNVKESIKLFYKDLNKITNGNKESIEDSKIIEKIEKLTNEILEIKETTNKLCEDIDKTEKNESDFKKDVLDLKNKIKEIKESKEYKEKLREKLELEDQKHRLNREIADLKTMIDFKELAGIYHSNKKQMEIVKYYRENFYNAFKEDGGKFLLELLKIPDSNLNKNIGKIQEKINDIIKQQREISEFITEKDEVLEIENEIIKIQDKIVDLNNEKSKIQKKIFRFEEKTQDIKNVLNQELRKAGAELIF